MMYVRLHVFGSLYPNFNIIELVLEIVDPSDYCFFILSLSYLLIHSSSNYIDMNMAKPKLLLLGATGYIAGVLLSHWHEHGFQMLPFDVTVSGRSRERLALLEKLLGISTVALSFENLALLEEEVQKYDIVVQLADCDAMAATHTILRGMKARYDSTRTPPLLFHASGAGN